MIDHLDDLESDFSAIHRIDDIYALDGPRFFRMAYRIGAYQGVIRMRHEEQIEREHARTAARAAVASPSRSQPAAPVSTPLAVAIAPPAGVAGWSAPGESVRVS